MNISTSIIYWPQVLTASSRSFSSDLMKAVHARASVELRNQETRETMAARVVICVSRAFFSTDQEKRETARSQASDAVDGFDFVLFNGD